jgi:uncharacterized membrane protein SirB2
MSYPVYKIIHIVSIVLFFALYAAAAVKAKHGENFKLEKILTGVMLLLIITGGMGLGARLGVMKGGWPLWLQLKLGIWFVIGASGHMILKRAPHFAMKFFWIMIVLLVAASYLANYKIG